MALLRFSSVSKSYWRAAREIRVLHEVDLALEAGDFAAVLGERRSGKSTLLRLAAGLERADAGAVSVDGRSFAEMSDAERAEIWQSRLASVWSTATWPTRRVLDTVAVPLLVGSMTRREARSRAREELRRWDVGDLAAATTHELSDAERQRVAFAHALVRRPRVLLADGPTETLSMIERNQILGRLQQVVREEQIAVLMTTTDASGAVGINRLMHLVGNGELREAKSLTPAQVIPFPTVRPREQAVRRDDA